MFEKESSIPFTYAYDHCGEKKSTTIHLNDNYDGTIKELVCLVQSQYKIPKHHEDDLQNRIENFLIKFNESQSDSNSKELIDKTRKEKCDIEDVTKSWEKLLREETAEYGERRCASDEELFATAYHKLVHSPALETMLQLEHVYSQTVREKTDEKYKKIDTLSEQQAEEMNIAVNELDITMTEYNINELATKHFEDQSLMRVELASELDTIKEAQRREYREWLMQMLEQNQANSSLPSPKSPLTNVPFRGRTINPNILPMPGLEESFTIHLGSQLKQMHNIRILSANVMDLCGTNQNLESLEPTPQLLQTALALYSNDLCGLVLMTDNVVACRQRKEFTEICERSTEFHFPHIEDQLEKISNNVLMSRLNSKHLNPGDFYITRHSNLAQVHVIFHMVTDDSLRGNDINSRHAVLLGLRNILKCACSNDVTSLTIPLLLQYEMTDEMTVSWCAKRAELVFKCVKGFMIEMASWGGSDLKNLQFLVPEGISTDVFQSLTTMLPSIFKVSNPLVLKSSGSGKID